jgi:ABC-type sugar transport system permease subunit
MCFSYIVNSARAGGALGRVGLEALQSGWLGDRLTALPALFITWSWIHDGFTMVIFIAALEGIDEVYFEAAKLDGAGWWGQLRHVLFIFAISFVMLRVRGRLARRGGHERARRRPHEWACAGGAGPGHSARPARDQG